jgi:hypothetical protein
VIQGSESNRFKEGIGEANRAMKGDINTDKERLDRGIRRERRYPEGRPGAGVMEKVHAAEILSRSAAAPKHFDYPLRSILFPLERMSLLPCI